MFVFFSAKCTLGTNPISVAAPAKDGDSFELDMATSAVALGKVGTITRMHVTAKHKNIGSEVSLFLFLSLSCFLSSFLSQVELQARNGRSIPEGWGCDANGLPSSDPKVVLSGGGLVPVGGSETTGLCFCLVRITSCSMSLYEAQLDITSLQQPIVIPVITATNNVNQAQ